MIPVQRFSHSPGDPDQKQAKILRALSEIEFPGYSFLLVRADLRDGGAQFFLRVCKENALDSEQERSIQLNHYSFAVNGDSQEQLVRGIYEQICMLELHEVAEHFRYKGSRIYQPHIRPASLRDYVSRLAFKDGHFQEAE